VWDGRESTQPWAESINRHREAANPYNMPSRRDAMAGEELSTGTICHSRGRWFAVAEYYQTRPEIEGTYDASRKMIWRTSDLAGDASRGDARRQEWLLLCADRGSGELGSGPHNFESSVGPAASTQKPAGPSRSSATNTIMRPADWCFPGGR